MDKTIDMAREAGMVYRSFEDEFANANTDGVDLKTLKAFEALVRADERKAVLDTIDELMGMERDRHPMFSDGYDHALQHIAQFVRGRGNA